MKVDVTECIIELLHGNKVVGIPNIGSFSVKNINASIQSGKIYPPFKSVQFSKEETDSNELIELIRKKYKINKSTANSVIKKFTQLLLNKMVNFNQVRLPNLGVFNTDASGVVFKEERNIINASRNLLPAYELMPISVRHSSKETTVAPVEAKTEAKSTVTPLASKSTETKPIQTKAIYTSPPKKEAGCLTYFWPLLLLLLIGFLLIFGLKKCTNEVNNNADVIAPAEEVGSPENSDLESSEDFVYDPSREYSLEEAQAFPNDVFENGCIVIVGSFKKNRNILNMITKVESFGYDSYKSFTEDGLTRVGVKLDCDANVLESKIQKIRKEIEPTSWYLIPNVKVDYLTN